MAYTIFLDRDGVINQDSPAYIKDVDEFHFIPGSDRAVARLSRAGFNVIVITNQSAVGRGMITPKTLEAIFDKMRDGVARAGGTIKDIFFCPHRPDQGCACRKPAPGMILSAAQAHGIDLNHTLMVGDSAKDMDCAKAAGCGKTILVATGNGKKAQKELDQKGALPDLFVPDLAAAADWILSHISPN